MRPFAPFNARPLKSAAHPKPGPGRRLGDAEDKPPVVRAARRGVKSAVRRAGPALKVLKRNQKST